MSPIQLAMWSGPRNISTAMMRSWENRSDTIVIDEPLYAHYLEKTGIQHPMRDDIIASQETNWQRVVAQLTHADSTTAVVYQKHITTHMLDHIALGWTNKLRNCFLLRDPRKVVASYARKRSGVCATDLGYHQQLRVFEYVLQHNVNKPLVIDSDRFLKNPEAHLRWICEQLAVPFSHDMLSWPAGSRKSDGIWSKHWYDAVEKSTGFNDYRPSQPALDSTHQAIADECFPAYQSMMTEAYQK